MKKYIAIGFLLLIVSIISYLLIYKSFHIDSPTKGSVSCSAKIGESYYFCSGDKKEMFGEECGWVCTHKKRSE